MNKTLGDSGDRLAFFTCLYLCLPTVIFLCGWFTPYLALPIVLSLLLVFYRVARNSHGGQAGNSPRMYFPLLALLALLWVLCSAAGGLFDQANGDWLKHSTVFADLARQSWPVSYPQLDEQFQLLRYYLGWYLPPALLAKLFGLQLLSPAILLWTTLGVFLVLLWFTRPFKHSMQRTVVASAVLVFFSGMDILRILWLGEPFANDTGLHPPGSYTHLEWHVDNLRLQYSSHTTALFWVPQHFIPAALLVSLLTSRLTPVTGLAFASGVLWSPLISLGVLPLLAVFMLRQLQLQGRALLNPTNILLAPIVAGLILLYLFSGSLQQTSAWLWDLHEGSESLRLLFVFLLCELAVLVVLLLYARRSLLRDPLFICALLVLVTVPLFSYGRFNDFGMRASLPALFYLSLVCAKVVLDQAAPRMARQLLVFVLLIGAATPLAEFNRARNFPLGPMGPVAELLENHYGFSTKQRSMAELQPFEWLKQYFGRAETSTYARLRRE